MAEYLIVFNSEWVPEHTDEQLMGKARAAMAVIAEMKEAGVFVFAGGLDPDEPVWSVDASSGAPEVSDGPFIESKEHLGGFTVVDVADEQQAKFWAGRVAVACGWPQQIHRIQTAPELE